MKTLIEKSIKFRGIGRPELITLFNIESDDEKTSHDFVSLTKISGRLIPVLFTYTEGDVETASLLRLQVIKSEDEEELKNFVLQSINNSLN